MIYKNSFKILISKFNVVWKVLLHLIIAGLLTTGFCLLSAMPIINVLKAENFSDSFIDIKNSIFPMFDINGIVNGITNSIDLFFTIIANNFSHLFIFIILFFISLFVLGGFFVGLYRVATSNVLYRFMTSNTSVGYNASFVSTLKTNLKFELMAGVTILPFNLVIALLVYYTLKLITVGGIVAITTPFIFMFVIIILNSLKLTIFSGWIPSMLANNNSVISGLKNGFKSINRNFGKVFSNALSMVITILVVNLFVAVFTFGVGLFVSIPASYLVIMIFNMVSYFENQGISYYVESKNVVIPKKMEETEDIRKIKYIV